MTTNKEDSPATPMPSKPTVRPPSTTTAGPIDFTALMRRWDDDLELVSLFLEKFRRVAPTELSHLRNVVADGDVLETAQVAHGLKGAASYVSAVRIQKLAGEMEALGHRADLTLAESVINELDEEVKRCLEAIPGMLESLRPAPPHPSTGRFAESTSQVKKPAR